MLGTQVFTFGRRKSDYRTYSLEMVVEPAAAEAFIQLDKTDEEEAIIRVDPFADGIKFAQV